MGPGLYVETLIGADLDVIWGRTQQPDQHQRWDLRFTYIDPLPRASADAPLRFRYGVRPLPGWTISGTGISAGEKRRPDGTRTSALRFSSPHPLCPLVDGRGYWRYVPEAPGSGGPSVRGAEDGGLGAPHVRFLTGYDYVPRWGAFGRVADRFLFRPLMGWATAWSFDRLRLWCERGITPESALRRALGELALRALALGAAAAVAYGLSVPEPGGGLSGVLAGTVRWAAVLLLAGGAVLVPPLPGTPAARRCRRRPVRRETATPPVLLERLEQP
ncbi:hypothetical protein [Streptomyces sp. HNM0574]|uniref:hypothetical protein n=1 Tax=Streptomyces sp. HNM0574 TaxID=2714954 RepID=UPI00146D9FCF|nr:hypothetical protein [Streptomyces sp. HNM0574]NLU68967.1 hypothetical protein [Streptomyces sp. HNM0574]